jgi:hypothetical protein|tara:strand:+ start:20301 stop:20594 length:294 start_codon:yes stop_codon:yes gene_type:complete
MSILKLKSVEAALVANDTHASTVSDATLVRVFNSNSSSSFVVTLQTASANSTVNTGAVVKGSLSVSPFENILMRKDPSDEIWAASTDVKAAAVSYEG